MEGLNPNAPPPKNTETRIDKWEYSDPIGVPHPDSIVVVVSLKNAAQQPASDVTVEIAHRWQKGPLTGKGHRAWTDSAPLKQVEHVGLAPGASQTIRVPLDLKHEMDVLSTQKQWPYALDISVGVRGQNAQAATVVAKAELPITPGD